MGGEFTENPQNKIPPFGYGLKLKSWGDAGFGLWFHLPRCHFGTTFLSRTHFHALLTDPTATGSIWHTPFVGPLTRIW